jgi:F-type H+-transporting ATPase subunit c
VTVSAAKLIGAGIATVGLVGPGTGSGVVFSGLLCASAYNPFLRTQLFAWAILGFALTEALALFALMMAFLILFAF